MFGTFLIVFREGLEAFLLVGILLAYLRKLEATRYSIWIFAGAIAGALVAFATAFVFQFVVSEFHSKAYRLLLTAAIMLLAACVLTYMAIWMQKQAKEMTGSAKEHLREYVSTGNVIGVAFLSFISVWRESMETILFLSALMFSGVQISWIGGVLGAVLAMALVWLMMRGARHVPIGSFFRWSSLLVLIIAAGLLSSATNILQGLGYLPGPTTALFDLSPILPDTGGPGEFLRGLFGYDASPTPLQFAVWLVFMLTALTLWHRAYSPPAKAKQA
ncbi:MAG: FTR1 family protein [Pseudomonadota bacterium]